MGALHDWKCLQNCESFKLRNDFRNAIEFAKEILKEHFINGIFQFPEDGGIPVALTWLEYGELAPSPRTIKFSQPDLDRLLLVAQEKTAEFDAVVELCIMRAKHGPFEVVLEKFHAGLLRQKIRRPTKSGPDGAVLKNRKYVIARAAFEVIDEFHLLPYRNLAESGPHESACDAVALALGEIGYHTRQYSSVEKIVSEWDIHERLKKKLTIYAG